MRLENGHQDRDVGGLVEMRGFMLVGAYEAATDSHCRLTHERTNPRPPVV